MAAKLDISVVVPLYNERESLPELMAWIDRVCSGEKLSYEVIMVDDGSNDGSWQVVEQLKEQYGERLRAIHFMRNYGKSAALYCGFEAAEGEVVIQTSDPSHPLLRQVLNDDYAAMAREQLAERQSYFYPPYARLTVLTLKHQDVQLVRRAATELATRLRRIFHSRLLGPIAPVVDRIRGEYLMQLMLKIEASASRLRANELVAREVAELLAEKDFKTVTISINVDPR